MHKDSIISADFIDCHPFLCYNKNMSKTNLPKIAIVGRPNVGKSSLFNRIIGSRKAIVESASGTTRDRLYAAISWKGKDFTIIDTGGFEASKRDLFGFVVQQQERSICRKCTL